MKDCESLEMDIASKIHRLVFAMDKQADQLLRSSHEISLVQCMIMMVLDHHPRVTQRFLVQQINMTPGAISRQVDILVSKRLITRMQNKLNRREHQLKVTRAGGIVLRKARVDLDEALGKMFGMVSTAEKQSFSTFLDTVLAPFTPEIEEVKDPEEKIPSLSSYKNS